MQRGGLREKNIRKRALFQFGWTNFISIRKKNYLKARLIVGGFNNVLDIML